MKITAFRLRTLHAIGKNASIEFKRAGDEPKSDTFETVFAFLNTVSCDLLLGVEDTGIVTAKIDEQKTDATREKLTALAAKL